MEVQEWLGESNTLGIDIWNKKYRYNNESFDEWLDRVSGGDKHIRELIVQKKFLFAGRILAGRGIDKSESKRSLSNCYVIDPPEDNLESIFDTGKWIGRTYSYGGGCGTDISNLAPRGAKVRNAASESSGAVSFMDLYSLITGLISQNGRRGALMISLNVDHPDIEEFVTIKSDPKKVTKANISVKITDKFMEAVEKDEMFELYFKREETGEEIKREVNARALFALICTQAWDNAEPGVLFWDRITEYNLMQYDDNYQLAGTNPCGELPLPAGGSCLLSSINLAEFVNEDKTFNLEDFEVTVFEAIRAMNVVLDEGITLHPLQVQSDSAENWRPIGLGIMGLADMLIKMGITYGSLESINLCDEIGKKMAMCAICQSVEEAETYGDFPRCNKYDIIRSEFFQKHAHPSDTGKVFERGIRNCQLLSIAPTGSLSTMLGISGGIEPIFDIYYERKTETLNGDDKYYKIYTQVVWDYMQKHGLKEGEEDKLPEYFVTAKTIDYRDRVKMQGVWQSHIDNSISSTVNLPNSATIEDVMDLYMRAWKEGCKGITIFREGCKRAPILNSDTKKEKKPMTISDYEIHTPPMKKEEMPEKTGSHTEDSGRVEQLKRAKEAWEFYSARVRADERFINRKLGSHIKDIWDPITIPEKIKSLENRLENKDYNDDNEKYAIIRTLDWYNFVLNYDDNNHEQRNKEIAEKIINENPMDSCDFKEIYKDWNRGDQIERITERWNQYVTCGDKSYYLQHMSYSPSFASYDEYLEWVTYVYNVIEFCKTNIINLVSMKILLSLWEDVEREQQFKRIKEAWKAYSDRVSEDTISVREMLLSWKDEVKDSKPETHLYGRPIIVETNPDGTPIDKKYVLKFQKDIPQEGSSIYPVAKEGNTLERGEVIKAPANSIGKNRDLITGCGSLHFQAFFDMTTGDVVMTYLSKGSTGGCNSFMVGLSRMISMAGRAGINVYEIADQLHSVPACPSYVARKHDKKDTSKGTCCPVAIGYALIEMYEEVQEEIELGGVYKGSPLYYKLKEEKAMKEIVTDALPRVEWDDIERIQKDAHEYAKELEIENNLIPPTQTSKLADTLFAIPGIGEVLENMSDEDLKKALDSIHKASYEPLKIIYPECEKYIGTSEEDEEPEIGPVPKEVMELAIKDLAKKQDAEIRESLADAQSKDRSKIVDLITPKIQNGEITSYNELVKEITNLLQPIDIGPYNPRYLYNIQEASSLVRQEDVDALTQSVYRKLFGIDTFELSPKEMASVIDKKLSHLQDGENVLATYTPSAEIVDQIKDIYANDTGLCPECGNPLTFEGGCNTCKCCGWSKCD